MDPFSPRFLAQLEQIQREAERQSRLVQQIIPSETLETLHQIAEDTYKATAPIREVLQSPAFQQQLKTMQELSLTLSQIYVRPTITIADFETFNTLEKVATEVAAEVIEKPEDVQLATRQLVSTTKKEVKKGRLITPLSLPESISWEDVRVTFVDSHNVFIEFLAIGQKITVDYMDMGMWDGRTQKPNAQWVIWQALAENSGRIDWNSAQASTQLKKQKQLLGNALSSYFNIQGDPFKVYREAKAYELKMTMIPSGNTNKRHSLPDDYYYNELTPSVYEVEGSGYLD